MEILYVLLIILAATRLFGEVAVRFGQPALIGELLSGILLGSLIRLSPETFPIMRHIVDDEVFRAITDLGMFFLMLLAGLEMSPKELAKSAQGATAVAVAGMLVPFAAGFGLGWWLLPSSEYHLAQSIFLGTALSITAVPVAVKVLMDLGELDSKLGKMIVSAAIADDVLSLLLLAVLTGVLRAGEIPDTTHLLQLAGQTVLFFVITIAIGRFLLPRIAKWLHLGQVEELEFTALLVVALGFSVLAEELGLHFILGAFVAGLFFTRRTLEPGVFDAVKGKVSGTTTGFLAPVFFASIGLHLDPSAFTAIPGFLTLLTVLAILCKLLGAGVAARLLGLSTLEASAVGVGMSARGAVELVIADIALQAGLFTRPDPPPLVVEHLFSAVVIMAVATTLLSPIGLRLLLKRRS